MESGYFFQSRYCILSYVSQNMYLKLSIATSLVKSKKNDFGQKCIKNRNEQIVNQSSKELMKYEKSDDHLGENKIVLYKFDEICSSILIILVKIVLIIIQVLIE